MIVTQTAPLRCGAALLCWRTWTPCASVWTAAYGTLSDFMIAEVYGHPSTR